jgi:hypothetical protein
LAGKVKRTIARDLKPNEVVKLIGDHVEARKSADLFGDRASDLKGRIKAWLTVHGETDSDGHQWFELPEGAVDGVRRIKNELRVSRTFDHEKATELLKKKKLTKQGTTTITVPDEEKILALSFEGAITAKELDTLYRTSESVAVKVLPK